MYKKSLKIMSLLLVLCISFSFMGLNPANAVRSDENQQYALLLLKMKKVI